MSIFYQCLPCAAAKKCLTGAEWYQLEASRAVNQAVGRVIRHANDYGAILLCDYRFGNAAFKQKLSAWLRPHIKVFPNFGIALRSIREFYRMAEQDVGVAYYVFVGIGDLLKNISIIIFKLFCWYPYQVCLKTSKLYLP